MKKSAKIIIHTLFWLAFPLVSTFVKWADAHDSFPGFGSEPKPGFIQILRENFLSLLTPVDMGRYFTDPVNLLGIFFNFFIYLLLPVGVFYLFYCLLSPPALKAKNLKSRLIPALLLLLLPLLLAFIFRYLTLAVAWNFTYWLTMIYIVTIIFATLGTLFHLVENRVEAEKLAKEKLQGELALLKNQVNPHFLFNTLNNIDSLIKSNADRASETLVKLSEILRYMIYETNTDRVPLYDEIRYIESYIDLARIQYANQELVSFSVQGDPSSVSVAPMLFIPFIENAFKHCNDKNSRHAIRISFSIDHKIVNFGCSNRYDKTKLINKDKAHGIGLANIKRRLELIYPGKHVLNILEDNHTFTVTLSLSTYEH